MLVCVYIYGKWRILHPDVQTQYMNGANAMTEWRVILDEIDLQYTCDLIYR